MKDANKTEKNPTNEESGGFVIRLALLSAAH